MEIERKFLLEAFPTHLPLIKQATVYQGYLCTHPTVRIRKAEYETGPHYGLTFKGAGTLCRRELNMNLTEAQFQELEPLLEKSMIRKDYAVFSLPDGHRLECSVVDAGSSTGFTYAEVEFETIEDAKAWQAPDFLGQEVTEDPSYTMSAYWERKAAQ